MKFRQALTLYLLLYIALHSVTFGQVVNIPDSNLAQVIREELALPAGSEITVQDLHRLKILEAANSDIRNLSGLEHATNLEHLEVWANPISDLTPIANLKGLKALDAGDCLIGDITPVANLTMLTRLLLGDNQIRDISSVAKLANLTHLRLNENQISDIEPLANLTQLMFLRLSDNRIVNISSLANLAQLAHLRLHNNRIEDIGPLANLTNLIHLELQNNQIIDSTPLAELTSLEYLDTNNNPIFDPGSPLVEIPDSNLREAVREALNTPITQAAMERLTQLNVSNRGITDLTGLEFATELKDLIIWNNPITNLTPVAGLLMLKELIAGRCQIVDTIPLTNLTQLTTLNLQYNQITDIGALATLIQLKELYLTGNRITDVRPLAGLTRLVELQIDDNLIEDHSSLNTLSPIRFLHDSPCDMSPLPLRGRIEDRGHPSVVTAFRGPNIFNRPELSDVEKTASHDLWFGSSQFGLKFRQVSHGFERAGILDRAIQRRDEFLDLNPNMVFIVDIRMYTYPVDDFPEDWPYWIKRPDGTIISGSEGIFGLIDFTHPDIQDRIVQQAIAVSKCGLYDGIFFDWWSDDGAILADGEGDWSHKFRGNEAEQRARDNILQRIRAGTRPDFLIMGNVNRNKPLRTGRHLNGGFMETIVPGDGSSIGIEDGFAQIENTLLWLEQNLREPRINALEGWAIPTESPDSPINLRYMRAITCLSLTHSDGYVLFNMGLGHEHYWYDFWDADLGRPVGPKAQLYDENISGFYIREFTNGWAVYNHSGEPQVITLPEEVQGVASGLVNTEHALANLDGEMYLRAKPKNPADVNEDGVVNILDLTIIAQALGTNSLKADVNGDGYVNILDLVFVANAF